MNFQDNVVDINDSFVSAMCATFSVEKWETYVQISLITTKEYTERGFIHQSLCGRQALSGRKIVELGLLMENLENYLDRRLSYLKSPIKMRTSHRQLRVDFAVYHIVTVSFFLGEN